MFRLKAQFLVYNREFNGRQLMSPICCLIDFSVRTFCSTGGWNCAAVSNDGLGFMRVVGRALRAVQSRAIVTFVRVFWAQYWEERERERERGHLGPNTGARHKNNREWEELGGGGSRTRQLRFLCVPWWWTSCLAAWPGLRERENCFIHQDEFNVCFSSPDDGDTGVNTRLDTENSPLLPRPELFIAECNVQTWPGHWPLMGEGGGRKCNQPAPLMIQSWVYAKYSPLGPRLWPGLRCQKCWD